MNPIYFMSRAINVLDVIDHTTKPLTTEAYLDALGDDGMMLEAVTLEELEATYLYGLDTDERMMLEAITTTKTRIDKTMAAFVRSLNQQLNSSGMEANQAEIGKPAKSGQLAVMTARIPLSDGQSISVVFHSPSGDPGKIVANDDLVAFRFLLNKRDVTHVVAPSGGQDISLKQTCLTLSNLAERNSAKFQSKQAETKAKEAELATLQASTEQLQAEAADVIEKADQLTERAAEDSQKEAEIKAKLDKQVARNEELRRQLAGMGGDPAPSQTAKADPEPEQGSATEGGAELPPEPAVPAEPEKAAMPTDTIRKVNQELNMDGESTLSNGAKISKVFRDEDGSLEGYITLTEPGGKSYVLKSPSSQGAPMGDTAKKLYKAYREGKAEKYLGGVPAAQQAADPEPAVSEPEPTTDPALQQDPDSIPTEPVTAPLYWYGLKARPLSNGAQPAGHADYIAPEDARLASVVAGRPATDARWGAVAYAEPLSDEQVSQYELVDLSSSPAFVWNEQTRASKFAELSAMTNAMLQDGDGSVEIWQQVMTPNSPQVDKNPFYVNGKYEATEVTKAFQEAGYTGLVKSMFNQFIEQQWAAIEQANKSPEELEEERKKRIHDDGIAALESFSKGGIVPEGWSMKIDPEFGLRGAIEVSTPSPLPNGDEHGGYYIIPATTGYNPLTGGWKSYQANLDSSLTDEFGLLREDGGGMELTAKTWDEAINLLQEDYLADVAAATPPASHTMPITSVYPTSGAEQNANDGTATTAENQWGETDPDVLALLQQAEELRTTETNPERYLAELQRIGGELDKAGAVERHEPYLHTVSDRLTELME
ncbi:MAG: hypothetical protein ACRDC7_00985, partial [Aeromonas veronii]